MLQELFVTLPQSGLIFFRVDMSFDKEETDILSLGQ